MLPPGNSEDYNPFTFPFEHEVKKMKRVLLALLVLVWQISLAETKLQGNIQIQTSKTLEGKNNVDQLFGRSNLYWSFIEDSSFSSLIHIRAYPSGFGFEPQLGAMFEGPQGPFASPAIPNQAAPDTLSALIQIWQAWVRYRFPEFEIRIGRMVTTGKESKHFGNYLDLSPGGTYMAGRDGIHNALEFFNIYGPFTTQAHLGVGDVLGNRGYLRLSVQYQATPQLLLSAGEKSNIFDFIHYEINDEKNILMNTLSFGVGYQAHQALRMSLETASIYYRSEDLKYPLQFPVTTALTLDTKSLFPNLPVHKALDLMRFELEYLYNRKDQKTSYQNIDADLLWNVHFEKRIFKRMFLEASIFAAPTHKHPSNTGAGIRFSSEIN